METIKFRPLTQTEFAHNQKTWSQYISGKFGGMPQNHLLIALVYGTDPFKAFAPLKNQKKIESQGKTPWGALWSAANTLSNHLKFIREVTADSGKAKRYSQSMTPNQYRLMGRLPEPFFYMPEALIDELLPKIEAIFQGIKERQTP